MGNSKLFYNFKLQSALVIVDFPVNRKMSTIMGQKYAKIAQLCPLEQEIPLFQDALL